MQKAKIAFVLSLSLLLLSASAEAGDTRNYYTWCKSFSTGENLACSTHTEYGGTYSYTPGTAPKIYTVPDNTLFNVRYEAAGHEKTLFTMFVDSNVSSCAKGADCNFSNGKWETRCVWNSVDAWVCTIYYQEAQINQYYLQTDYSVRNYIYLAQSGSSNSPPIITAVRAMSYPENTGYVSKIVDLWFYTGDDRTPKQDLLYTIVSQTNPGVVSCTVDLNRYINCLTQPSANGESDITFSAKDAGGAATSSTFRITITPAKPAPSSPAPAAPGAKFVLPSTPAGVAAAPAAPSDTPSENPDMPMETPTQ
ncbi:MAG: hypothetical protein JXL20_04475 [Deltaproteobacteria bacterium]|nr:hypothetical protein [Deltaproteobacteria bacterium]